MSVTDLNLSVSPLPGHTVVAIRGEVDTHSAPVLRAQLLELIRAGHHHLVLDLEAVEFLDSSGLGVFIRALSEARRKDGSLQLVCTQERILKILRITGLTEVFPINCAPPAPLS